MNSCILGLGTEVPQHQIFQKDGRELVYELFDLTPEQKEQVRKLYDHSGIVKRHAVVSDFNQPREKREFLGSHFPSVVPGMTIRNEIYKKEAPLLAKNAALKALKEWGGDPADITHVISVSCTGVVVPGLEFLLIDALGLKRNVFRLGINFMGCFGAFKGLHVANSFAAENPKHRILLVCTELCSLHFQGTVSDDTLASNSLFADGAAAAVVGSEIKDAETPLWKILKFASVGLEDSLDQMTWEASDHGLQMTLSGFVPLKIARNIKPFVNDFLGTTPVDTCDFAIHPGGKAILQVIERRLKLNAWQIKSSYDVLSDFGNMSSATFLFVLEQLYKQKNCKPHCVGLGFGPGLSVEGILLGEV